MRTCWSEEMEGNGKMTGLCLQKRHLRCTSNYFPWPPVWLPPVCTCPAMLAPLLCDMPSGISTYFCIYWQRECLALSNSEACSEGKMLKLTCMLSSRARIGLPIVFLLAWGIAIKWCKALATTLPTQSLAERWSILSCLSMLNQTALSLSIHKKQNVQTGLPLDRSTGLITP